jgi:hypothetical protein
MNRNSDIITLRRDTARDIVLREIYRGIDIVTEIKLLCAELGRIDVRVQVLVAALENDERRNCRDQSILDQFGAELRDEQEN